VYVSSPHTDIASVVLRPQRVDQARSSDARAFRRNLDDQGATEPLSGPEKLRRERWQCQEVTRARDHAARRMLSAKWGSSRPLDLDARVRACARASSRCEGTPSGVHHVRHHRPEISVEHLQDVPRVGAAGHGLLDRAGVGAVTLSLPLIPCLFTQWYMNGQRCLEGNTCKSLLFQSARQIGKEMVAWACVCGNVPESHPCRLPYLRRQAINRCDQVHLYPLAQRGRLALGVTKPKAAVHQGDEANVQF
jgi:hypothetical protein